MMQGRLIVMEGIDGSGKSTQYRLLREWLEREGTAFRSVSFPRYGQPSSALVREYLAGAYGERPGDVNPYAASTFYTVDRFAAFRTDWGAYYRAGGPSCATGIPPLTPATRAASCAGRRGRLILTGFSGLNTA